MIFNFKSNKKLPSMTALLGQYYGGVWKNVPFKKYWYEENGNGSVWGSCTTDEYENIVGRRIHYYNNGSEFLGFNITDAKLYLMDKIDAKNTISKIKKHSQNNKIF